MKRYFIFIIGGILFLAAFCSCSGKINSTEKLMEAISKKYNGKWFRQIKFSQTTSFYEDDTVYKTERWIEEYIYPSQLIIKVNHENSLDGQLYRNDSMYVFKDNKIEYQAKATHDLLILSMDIYNMTKDEIMTRLSGLEYDISKFHETTYNNRKIYVIGAEKGDSTSNQLWYDAENLYFIKMTKNTKKGLQEVIFSDYINIEGQGWIEQEIVFKINGKTYLKEKYYNIQIPTETKKEINVNDFKNFNISLERTVQYIIEYGICNQGRRVFVTLWDNLPG